MTPTTTTGPGKKRRSERSGNRPAAPRKRDSLGHLLSLGDLRRDEMIWILDRAAEFAGGSRPSSSVAVIGLMFFQASTRTRIGFGAAAARLGGASVEIDHSKDQLGMAAPESLEDTIRVVGAYCDLLVLRHGSVEAVTAAARVSPVPLINAGSGQRYHPTQALIDLYAIRKHLGRLDGLRIGIAGDIRTSRTGHSLLRALAWCLPEEVRLMAPSDRGPDAEVLEGFPEGVVSRDAELELADLDLLYMAGMPPGVGEDCLSEATRDRFFLTVERMARLPETGIVLCALPRTGDVDPEVDSDPRAVYFEQSADGLFVRMAVLEHILKG